MSLVIRATYENGVFRPITPVGDMAEGTDVVLKIEPVPKEDDGAKRSLTKKEVRQLIASKNPSTDPNEEAEWDEIARLTELALRNVRDPELMRQGAEHMDQLREQIYKREGLLDIVMPLLRESRDEG
jgi:predicted DNA-binding antitoxin AbrB/MazE fold protein